MVDLARLETADIFGPSHSRATLKVAEELYPMSETSVAVLRAELDLEKERSAELRTLVHKKHGDAKDDLAACNRRIDALVTTLHERDVTIARLVGDPADASDTGRIGSHDKQLGKLWAAREKDNDERVENEKLATNERWKLRLAMAGYGGGSAAGVIGILKLLGG